MSKRPNTLPISQSVRTISIPGHALSPWSVVLAVIDMPTPALPRHRSTPLRPPPVGSRPAAAVLFQPPTRRLSCPAHLTRAGSCRSRHNAFCGWLAWGGGGGGGGRLSSGPPAAACRQETGYTTGAANSSQRDARGARHNATQRDTTRNTRYTRRRARAAGTRPAGWTPRVGRVHTSRHVPHAPGTQIT